MTQPNTDIELLNFLSEGNGRRFSHALDQDGNIVLFRMYEDGADCRMVCEGTIADPATDIICDNVGFWEAIRAASECLSSMNLRMDDIRENIAFGELEWETWDPFTYHASVRDTNRNSVSYYIRQTPQGWEASVAKSEESESMLEVCDTRDQAIKVCNQAMTSVAPNYANSPQLDFESEEEGNETYMSAHATNRKKQYISFHIYVTDDGVEACESADYLGGKLITIYEGDSVDEAKLICNKEMLRKGFQPD